VQDPDHSYQGARVEYDHGACDGWLLVNDTYSIGYYGQTDLPFLGRAAPGWTTFDRYFAAFLGPTFPNRIYQHAGVTDRISNTTTISTLPTIWDGLAAAGVSNAYYYSDVPFLALWGTKYLGIAKPYTQFLADAASGSLPAVSYLDPRFQGEDQGISNDDHPHADIRVGEGFLNDVYTAVTGGPGWPNTVLIITFDEWGGFFEHVPPHRAPDVLPAYRRRGFRIPVVLISPFAQRGRISHAVYDHTSILRMIEWRFGLAPLSVRDAHAHNLARELDTSHPNLDAPAYDVPVVTPTPCGPSSPGPGDSEWAPLAELAARVGFQLGG
jgi:phospholipase C